MKNKKMSPTLEMREGIHGVGIFVTKDIKKGDILFMLTGRVVDHPTRTSVQIGKDKHIENSIAGCINHSCKPNAEVQKFEPYAFVSLREIAKGEEITFDYNANEDKMACPFICACCGRYVAGKEITKTLATNVEKDENNIYKTPTFKL